MFRLIFLTFLVSGCAHPSTDRPVSIPLGLQRTVGRRTVWRTNAAPTCPAKVEELAAHRRAFGQRHITCGDEAAQDIYLRSRSALSPSRSRRGAQPRASAEGASPGYRCSACLPREPRVRQRPYHATRCRKCVRNALICVDKKHWRVNVRSGHIDGYASARDPCRFGAYQVCASVCDGAAPNTWFWGSCMTMPATPFIDLLSAITVSLEEALCGYCRMTVDDVALFDYHGALVVVETDVDEIVFIHPPGGPAEAPASLPSTPCRPREAPADAAVRMVREMTGLQVTIVREFASFIQEGTPTGTMFAHCYVARVYDGSLIDDGPEGPARSYPLGRPSSDHANPDRQPAGAPRLP